MKKILLPLLILFSALLVITLLVILFLSSPILGLINFFYFYIALFIWIISPIGLIFLYTFFIYLLTKSKIIHLLIWVFQVLAGIGWASVMFWLVAARTEFFQENIFRVNEKALDAGIVSGVLFFVIMLIIVLIQINHSHNSLR